MTTLLHCALLALTAVPGKPSFLMPREASTVAGEVDHLFYLVLGISAFFFLLVVGIMLYFVIRYRYREGVAAEKTATHNTALEVTWTVIPLTLALVIFAYGFKGFIDIVTPPANAYEVLVTAQKWSWQFTYPNGYVDKDLHVPVNRPVRLVMQSQDVIHSLYVPAFRIKRDVVPGRYNKAWFQATTPGEYQLFCAEYCGTGHSTMLAKVIVHRPGGFDTWLADASNLLKTMSPVDAGRHLYTVRGCAQCHSIDGSGKTGPTFKGFFGHKVVLSTGQAITADEDYVRESILDPQAKVVAGFEPVMPTFQGRLTNEDITSIIQYLKSLSAGPKGGGGK
jgi:cytochrome c oxidase subunit II